MKAPQNEAQAMAFAKLMVNEADINRHMIERDSAEHVNVKAPSSFLDGLVSHFTESEIAGDCMPWQKTYDLIRFRHSEVTI